jgi:hypothetical protein
MTYNKIISELRNIDARKTILHLGVRDYCLFDIYLLPRIWNSKLSGKDSQAKK